MTSFSSFVRQDGLQPLSLRTLLRCAIERATLESSPLLVRLEIELVDHLAGEDLQIAEMSEGHCTAILNYLYVFYSDKQVNALRMLLSELLPQFSWSAEVVEVTGW